MAVGAVRRSENWPAGALHDAVFAQQAAGLLVTLTEPLHADRPQACGELPPTRADLAAVVEKLVIAPRQPRVVRKRVFRGR